VSKLKWYTQITYFKWDYS